jgi:lipopolysaccharide/colanic/teichoic acid biosynthesis glycosyltransferase
MSSSDKALKRCFDISASAIGLVLTGWLIVLAFIAASIDTGKNGFFVQSRVGRNGRLFKVVKIRTMRDMSAFVTSVTTSDDPRITWLGRLLRKMKLDELPQLINIFLGHMSFVGPRPDVPGFADRLQGDDRLILTLRPGITGPATLKYRNEEQILAAQEDPEKYNREVIFPDKVRLNLEYIKNYGFWKDMKYIIQTITGK